MATRLGSIALITVTGSSQAVAPSAPNRVSIGFFLAGTGPAWVLPSSSVASAAGIGLGANVVSRVFERDVMGDRVCAPWSLIGSTPGDVVVVWDVLEG